LLLEAAPPTYPVVIRNPPQWSCARQLRVTGVAPQSLTWRQWKSNHDGDGILMKVLNGNGVVEDSWFHNTMDPISWNQTTGSWITRRVYARYTRDDFIENDSCRKGLVEDVLVDNAFMFISTRPGGGSTCQAANTVTVRNALVHLGALPYDGDMKGSPAAAGSCGHGQLFKWTASAGPVDVRNSIFRVDCVSVNGPNSMSFPAGTYENVTLIWGGAGAYPAAIPPGVTVTRDLSVWDEARAAWLRRHGCDDDGDYCSFAGPVAVEPDPIEPDPVEPDPVEPDPIEPDPIEPDPVEPDPVDPIEETPEEVVEDEPVTPDVPRTCTCTCTCTCRLD
jgi:hypothetical protein